jgi:hypothetical protein
LKPVVSVDFNGYLGTLTLKLVLNEFFKISEGQKVAGNTKEEFIPWIEKS